MSSSAVIFGATGAGKSTLIGYMYAKKMRLDMARFDEKTKRELESLGAEFEYQPDLRYAYVSDTFRLERRRLTTEQGLGTTHYMHIIRIKDAGGDVTVVDTPGRIRSRREATKGFVMGDVGVFMIDITKLLEMAEEPRRERIERPKTPQDRGDFVDFLAPLYTWMNHKKGSRPIVVLSMFDLVEDRERDFAAAKTMVMDMTAGQVAAVVPTCIHVREGWDENVMEVAEAPSGYVGPSFSEVLTNALAMVTQPAEDEFFAYVDRKYRGESIGSRWRIKVMSGSFGKDDRVKLLPIKSRDPFAVAEATVSSIKDEKGPILARADAGAIVGMRVRSVRQGKRSVQPKELELSRTSIVLKADVKAVMGDVVQIDVPERELATLERNMLEPLAVLDMLWFGRFVRCTVIEVQANGEDLRLICQVTNKKLALPSREVALRAQNVVVRHQRAYLKGEALLNDVAKDVRSHFFCATISGITSAESLSIPVQYIRSEGAKGDSADFEPVGSEAVFRCQSNSSDVLRQIMGRVGRDDYDAALRSVRVSLDKATEL